MSKNTIGNHGAFATTSDYHGTQPGLTKREYFAAMAMQSNVGNIHEYKENAERAVMQADALIEALNASPKGVASDE